MYVYASRPLDSGRSQEIGYWTSNTTRTSGSEIKLKTWLAEHEMDEMRSSKTQWSADHGDVDRTWNQRRGLVPAILNIERFGFEGSQTL
jgi:Tfp pilus assembly protein PilV